LVASPSTFGAASRAATPRSSGSCWRQEKQHLIVIGESRLEEQLDKALTRAEKSLEKEIDADNEEFRRDLEEAEKEAAAS
jgi:hypothetical protein